MNSEAVAGIFEKVEVSKDSLNAVAGISVIDDSLLTEISGGLDRIQKWGWFLTVSGECMGGIDCNPFN